jgi:eukaryotic-like serine/threonine-protein kinase
MNGKTLGHYRVGEQLGRGGMGEVYLADDLNLNRKVALKFLPEAFTGDPERMARFEREAKLLATLNHPNIAAIYGLEEAEGKRFLVLELVEGETLAQRLSKGPLPVEEALEVCCQIAEGLEAAHEKGVIHRDLKPANVMITEGDKVKILDFGLAKALAGETQGVDASQSPTLTDAMTQRGMILGTAAYMSPEQAKGKAVDKRADIWAFGCILFECLTGKRVFEGETITETLAAVLKGEPNWEALPAAIPPNIRFVLRRCLEKETKRRFGDAAAVRIMIEEARGITEAAAPAKRPWLWISVTALFFVVSAVLSLIHFREKPLPLVEPMRFQIALPDKVSLSQRGEFALSPNGRILAFPAAGSDGVARIWVRALNSLEARPLSGTEFSMISSCFWSPDSRFIAFDADLKLKKIDVSGGPPQTLCDASSFSLGGSWNREGVIIFGGYGGSVMRVSAAGGVASQLTMLDPDRREGEHTHPTFLPDGKHFLYLRNSSLPENSGIYVGSLDAKPEEQSAKQVLPTNSPAVYVPSQDSGPGQLLFLREQMIMAQRFDETRFELVGDPVILAEQVGSLYSFALYSASTNGVLIYGENPESRLIWIDRTGRELGMIGEPDYYETFDLSKDASRLAVAKTNAEGRQNLWVMDLLRDSTTRLTLEDADHSDPRWSPEGRKVIFASTRDPSRSPFEVSLPASDPIQVFKFGGKTFGLDDWSPDGNYLLYHDTNQPELWALPLAGDRKPMLVTRSLSGFADQGQFSPDGRWIAFNTNESGRHEVKVVPFPPNGEKWQISTSGGVQPTWRGDGKELYFLAPDAALMAVDVRPGATFAWGEPHPLYKTQIDIINNDVEQYAPDPNGKRFLFRKPAGESAPFTVILNWTSLLRK